MRQAADKKAVSRTGKQRIARAHNFCQNFGQDFMATLIHALGGQATVLTKSSLERLLGYSATCLLLRYRSYVILSTSGLVRHASYTIQSGAINVSDTCRTIFADEHGPPRILDR